MLLLMLMLMLMLMVIGSLLDCCSSCSSICSVDFVGCGECRVREDGMDHVPVVWIG